ncbi:MAG TPA: recombinase family protein [Polyangiaceae bacterium]
MRAGAVAGREGYKRLVDAAKAGAYEILLVEETSRYSRDFWGGLTELAALRKYKVRLADTKIGAVDLDSALGQMQIAFGLVSSQQETTRLGERSKRGLKGKVLSKFSSGGVAPYGYVRAPIFSDAQVDVDGRPVRVGVRFDVHATESPVVRRMFDLYAAGASKHSIAAQLNREGVPTRGAGGTRNGRPNSGTWSTSTVKGILENEVYSGLRLWNKTSRRGEKHAMSGKKAQLGNQEKDWVRVEGYAPRIVEPSIWEQVQRRLRADNESYKANHVVNNRRQYLLSGSVKCASCGGAFVIGVHRGKPPVPHYRCSFHAARGSTVCANSIVVSQPALERLRRRPAREVRERWLLPRGAG